MKYFKNNSNQFDEDGSVLDPVGVGLVVWIGGHFRMSDDLTKLCRMKKRKTIVTIN